MTQIRIDDVLRNKFGNFSQVVEICDYDGTVIARVEPVNPMSEWEPTEPQISEEELDRREKSTKWYTTQEVLDHLKKLEDQ